MTDSIRRCRSCGCTDADCGLCLARTERPCSWAEADLCSACVEPSAVLVYLPPAGAACKAVVFGAVGPAADAVYYAGQYFDDLGELGTHLEELTCERAPGAYVLRGRVLASTAEDDDDAQVPERLRYEAEDVWTVERPSPQMVEDMMLRGRALGETGGGGARCISDRHDRR